MLALSGQAHPIFDAGAARRAHTFTAGLLEPAAEKFPELTGHADLVADVAVHLGWSVLCLDDPDSRSDEALRTFLTTLLAPLLESLEP